MRYRLRDATESTTSEKRLSWWSSGAPAPGFPIGSACCWLQRALSVSGVALTGLGSRSRRHVSRARDERRLLGYASRDGLYRRLSRGSADASQRERHGAENIVTDDDLDFPAQYVPPPKGHCSRTGVCRSSIGTPSACSWSKDLAEAGLPLQAGASLTHDRTGARVGEAVAPRLRAPARHVGR